MKTVRAEVVISSPQELRDDLDKVEEFFERLDDPRQGLFSNLSWLEDISDDDTDDRMAYNELDREELIEELLDRRADLVTIRNYLADAKDRYPEDSWAEVWNVVWNVFEQGWDQ